MRARELGLADPGTASVTHPSCTHTLGVDGKVFNSPQRTLDTERVDRATGEIRPVRQDPARGQHREGGASDVVLGTKFAIMSVRAPMAGLRVITGIQHVPAGDGRGEAGAFVDLACSAAELLPGARAPVGDGALRGTHINEIQTRTGLQVVSPPRTRSLGRGGVPIGGKGQAIKQLRPSPSRDKAFASCVHDLRAAGGIVERTIAADGTEIYTEVERGKVRRDALASGLWSLYAVHRLPCAQTGVTHEWSESLTPTSTDESYGFNRSEYMRAYQRSDPDYRRIYAMRQDTESFNVQFEQMFYKNRLPAWGLHRQTLAVLGAVMAQNAWALYVWHHLAEANKEPPGAAA